MGKRTFFLSALLTLAPFAPSHLEAAAAPTADTLKQVLTKRLKSLRPSGMTERDVLFQEVRAGRADGGTYPFQVTALIRDYGPGYPANRYYGETCVGHLDKVRFVLVTDDFGDWKVEGAMTPPMETHQCKKNPAAGATSIPLASLEGTPAPAGAIPAAAAPAAVGGQSAVSKVAQGSYECWANGSARMLLNFSIAGGTQYKGSDGKTGAYVYDAKTGRIIFKGGALDGALPDGFYAVYHEPKGRPTVSFRSPRGSEASFCEKVR